MNNEKHFFLLFKYICLKAGKHEIGRFGIYCFLCILVLKVWISLTSVMRLLLCVSESESA